MNKKLFIAFFVITSFMLSSVYQATTSNAATEPIATLTYKTNGGGFRPDYGLYIAQYLAEIGIKVNVKVEEWIVFVGTLTVTYDFDLAFVGLTGGGADPDLTGVYNENGSLNMFGINTKMPYGQQNEDMLKQGVLIMDLQERQQHYYQWQELLMDKILPMLPFFSPRSYVANWANLDGYDNRWGIIDSLPYMSFDGLHDGQVSADEINDHDAKWKDLNPLLQDDASSSYISSLVMEPILQMTPGFEPIKTGLVKDWSQDPTNPNLYKFTMRSGIYWNPSVNVTGRDSNSGPLVDEHGNFIATDDLMKGLQGVSSDGTNQEVTAKDAVFTYLAWANSITSEDPDLYAWIHRIWVDPADKYSFYVEIDGDPSTSTLDPYAPFWSSLTTRILPEFFLNSTDETVQHTTGGVPFVGLYDGILNTDAWKTFSVSAFGCGKFMLDYYVEGSITVLKASPFWNKNFHIGAIDGTDQTVDINTFNIRVIPDQTSALAEFKAGKLDIMGMTSFPKDRKEMETDPNFEVQSALTSYFNFMGFNLRRPFIGGDDNYVFLTDAGYTEYTKALAVRKAISYAINRPEINKVLHDGEYLISDSPIYPVQAFWYYNDIIKYNYDLDTAIAWLERAGYTQKQETTTAPIPIIGVVAAIMSFVLIRRKYQKH